MYRIKVIKKELLIIFTIISICMCNYAAIIGDSDGPAFVTKEEFEILKKEYNEQIDRYNSSIDKKIDGAIASYLNGIKLEKESKVALNNSIREVRCKYWANNTSTKDLIYVYCAPRISGTGTDWTCGYVGETRYGVYAHDFKWNSKSITPTGERNMIDDVYLDNTSASKSSARWLGHYKNVVDELTLTYSGIRLNGNYGAHMNGDNNQNQGLVSPANSLVYNKAVTSGDWILGTFEYTFERPGYWSYDYNVGNQDLKVLGYSLNTNSATIVDKGITLWGFEEYYAFTPVVQKYFGFDKVAVCGSESRTTGPKLHEAYSAGSPLSWWNASVNSSYCGTGFAQSNLLIYASYSYNTLTNGMYNADSLDNFSTRVRSTSYNKSKNRWIWPYPSFPYQHIKDWGQLYVTENDWAVDLISDLPTDGTIREDGSGKKHLSLNAGWPIAELKFEGKYEMEIEFKETDVDHLLFLSYGPFTNANPTIETSNTILQKDITHNGKTTSAYPNAILVEKGKKVKFSFESDRKGVLFLKWCNNVTSGSLNGGGTIILPDNITEIV